MSDGIVIADNSEDNVIVDLEVTKQQMETFEEFKKSILQKSDIAKVSINGVNRPLIKRSGWRKIQTACRLSNRIVEKDIVNTPEYTSAFYVIEVTAPQGRSGQGVGACDSKEKQSSRQYHDIVSTAYTRALNRAISDFVGMGELVYDEIAGRPVEEMNRNVNTNSTDCNCGNPYIGKSGAHCANCEKTLTNNQRNHAIDEGKTYDFWLQYCHCRAPDVKSKDGKICDNCSKDVRPEMAKLLEYNKMRERDPR